MIILWVQPFRTVMKQPSDTSGCTIRRKAWSSVIGRPQASMYLWMQGPVNSTVDCPACDSTGSSWNVEGNSNSRHGSGDGGPTNGGPLMAKQDKEELPWCFEHIAKKIRVYLCHWLSKSVWAGPRLWRCVTVSWWSTDGLGVNLSIKQNLEGGRLGLSWAWSGTEVAGLSANKKIAVSICPWLVFN